MTEGIHVCVGFYPNMSYVVNYVRDADLAANVEYNRNWRPGRAYFVDGRHVCGGPPMAPDASEFIGKCMQKLSKMKLLSPTTPSEIYE